MKTIIATIAFLLIAFPVAGQTVDQLQGVIDRAAEQVGQDNSEEELMILQQDEDPAETEDAK